MPQNNYGRRRIKPRDHIDFGAIIVALIILIGLLASRTSCGQCGSLGWWCTLLTVSNFPGDSTTNFIYNYNVWAWSISDSFDSCYSVGDWEFLKVSNTQHCQTAYVLPDTNTTWRNTTDISPLLDTLVILSNDSLMSIRRRVYILRP